MGPKITWGLKKFLGWKKILGQKNLGSENIFGSEKNFGSKKNLGAKKKFGSEIVSWAKNLISIPTILSYKTIPAGGRPGFVEYSATSGPS